MALSPLHAEARRLAAAGIPVFPCMADTKRPACARGFHEATTSVEQIDAWWSEDPEYNIARCPHQTNEAVIDIDGEEGECSWEAWQSEHGYLPATYTVRTPRGGLHYYFRGVLPPTQSKLGVHVDTRGVGSYALVPPSRVDGSPYAVKDPRAPADLPASVGEFLRGLTKERVTAAVEDLDLPQNVARARKTLADYLVRGKVAIEGQMGNLVTFQVACDLLNLGCSGETALSLMAGDWNAACEPPWEESELEILVQNAARYSQNEAGAWGVEASADAFKSALDKLDLSEPEASTQPKKRRFKRWSMAEMLALPPPEWLIPDLLPDKGVSLLYGPPGTYKTYVAVEWACGLAAAGTPVLYVAGEGSIGVSQRVRAWCLLHDVDPLTINLEIIRSAPWADDGEMLREFIEDELKPFNPTLVVMDTLARSAVGLDENSAKDMGKVVSMMDMVRNEGDCAVLVIHHSGKDAERGARGSGSLTAGVDAAFEIHRPSKDVKAVAVYCKRQKDAEERSEPWCYEGRILGDQMVLQEISIADFHGRTDAIPFVRGSDVGKALVALGATGEGTPVSTDVLAHKLADTSSKKPGESDAAKPGFVKALVKGAGGSLRAYCQGEPPELQWLVSEN